MALLDEVEEHERTNGSEHYSYRAEISDSLEGRDEDWMSSSGSARTMSARVGWSALCVANMVSEEFEDRMRIELERTETYLIILEYE